MQEKHYVLKTAFHGVPTSENFEIVESELPSIKDGEFIVDVNILTVDPYMRIPGFATVGATMLGEGVGKVVQSKNEKYPVGCSVFGKTGWSTRVVGNDEYRVIPSEVEHLSYALGALGMPGLTAYLEIENCQPKSGETFFVNASAGAVGSVVGQMAKNLGCRVVGCAGSEEKVAYLKDIGFDEAFNYKKGDFHQMLTAACPKGIDCFVDHVGGNQFDSAIQLMNFRGRIAIVGSISKYNATSPDANKGNYIHLPTIGKELTIKGVACFAHYQRFPEFISEVNPIIKQGKIKVREHFYDGFESMPKAFASLFAGEHIGKVVIRL